MGGFEEKVRGVLSDTLNLPTDFLSMIPQYVAQNPVSLARTPGTRITSGNRITNATSTGTTFAGGNDVLASPLTFTADGKTNYAIGIYARGWTNSLTTAVSQLHINLDGSDAGLFAQIAVPTANVGETLSAVGLIVTPASGSHTVNVRLRVSAASTATINAGAGGVGVDVPIFVTLEVA